MSLPFGFPDEYSARRTFDAVGAVERNLASPNKTYNAEQDYRIRITGAGTHAGTLTGWNVVAGELVNPSPTTTHDVAFSSVLVAYPSGAQAPAVNSVVMARIGWVDNNGVMVWTHYPNNQKKLYHIDTYATLSPFQLKIGTFGTTVGVASNKTWEGSAFANMFVNSGADAEFMITGWVEDRYGNMVTPVTYNDYARARANGSYRLMMYWTWQYTSTSYDDYLIVKYYIEGNTQPPTVPINNPLNPWLTWDPLTAGPGSSSALYIFSEQTT